MRRFASTSTPRKELRGVARVFGVALIASALLSGGLSAASAQTAGVGNTNQTPNGTVFHGTIRYNTHKYNSVRIMTTAYDGNSNIYYGIRNTAGTTVGRTSAGPLFNQWLRFTNNGTNAMPQGGFYMNSQANSYCGNPGCVPAKVNWSATLEWDISIL